MLLGRSPSSLVLADGTPPFAPSELLFGESVALPSLCCGLGGLLPGVLPLLRFLLLGLVLLRIVRVHRVAPPLRLADDLRVATLHAKHDSSVQ